MQGNRAETNMAKSSANILENKRLTYKYALRRCFGCRVVPLSYGLSCWKWNGELTFYGNGTTSSLLYRKIKELMLLAYMNARKK